MSGQPLERGGGRGRGRGRGRGEFQVSGQGQSFQPPPAGQRGGRGGSERGRGGGRGGPMEVQVFGGNENPPAPLSNLVMKAENDIETAIQVAKTKSTTKLSATLPRRPGFGTQGARIILWTNYFEMVANGNLLLHRYHIDVLSDQSGRQPVGKKLKRIVELLIEDHFSQYRQNIATDFKAIIISRNKLDINEDGYVVHYRAEGEDDPPAGGRSHQIRLQPSGTLALSELVEFLTSTQAGAMLESKDQMIQALNIVVGHHPKAASSMTSVGANRHFPLAAAASEQFTLGAGLQAIRGFFVSVRAATARILVNVQVKHAAFYDHGPLERLIAAYMNENGPSKARLAAFLKKLNINVTHIERKNKAGQRVFRIKSIQGLAARGDGNDLPHPPIVPALGAGAKEVQFFLEEGSESSTGGAQASSGTSGKKGKKKVVAPRLGPETSAQGRYISIFDFFKQRYNITIRDPTLPVMNVGTRQRPSYLPVQVCEVLSGQASTAKLSPAQTQMMIRNAVRNPTLNAKSIAISGAQVIGAQPKNPTVNAFGITITPKLLTVPGRVLVSPAIEYGGNKTLQARSGSWNMMQSAKFMAGGRLPSWTYLWIAPEWTDPGRDQPHVQASLTAFTTKLRQLGITAAECSRPGLHRRVSDANAEAEIDAAMRQIASKVPRPKLVLAIIPPNNAVIRNRVKYAGDVKEGLLTQCVIVNKFSGANDQYLTNVALKVNLKLGGRNQTLAPSKLGVLAEGKTMVVGIDVTHPSPGSSSNAPSVAAVVASIDKGLGQWPAELKIQDRRTEMVSGLGDMLKSRLRLWAKYNNANYPENILVYRDGVSEGQYGLVLMEELPRLRDACKELYPADQTKRGLPHITIIIVGKRHNTRFYPTRKEEADRSSNPQNGTVVDRGVTEARNWDFFLQAHTALQGTARPAHYYVVHDEIFQYRKAQMPFKNVADALEDLTHNLCYLFGRATKAVSICPAAYYADLVCDRARCYLSGVFDPSPITSPAGSVIEGQSGSGQAVDPSQVRIHENVRNAMFYI